MLNRVNNRSRANTNCSRANKRAGCLSCLMKDGRQGEAITRSENHWRGSRVREPATTRPIGRHGWPNGFFRAMFHRLSEFTMEGGTPGWKKSWEKLVERLGETERRIPRIIHHNRHVPVRAMATMEIGISTTATDKNLAKLKRKGVLRRIGPARGGHWEVVW